MGDMPDDPSVAVAGRRFLLGRTPPRLEPKAGAAGGAGVGGALGPGLG